MRNVSRPKLDEITGDWRGLYNKERRDLYSSHNTIRANESRWKGWKWHVPRDKFRVEGRCLHGFGGVI